jgi:hypothetical protein
MEGASRNLFDTFTKALAWPLAPQAPERPASVPEKTTMLFRTPASEALSFGASKFFQT